MGYDLDTYFIEKPHETSPRRLYSQSGVDWQYRVDFDRLRSDRLQRTREQMAAMDLGGSADVVEIWKGRPHQEFLMETHLE